MADDQFAPFTGETLEQLKAQVDSLDQADKLLDKAARAGIDVAEQKKKSADLRQQLVRFRQAFFPGQ
jgi:hypothetical protein